MMRWIHLDGPAIHAGLVRLALVLFMCGLFGCAGPKADKDSSTDVPQRRPRCEYSHAYLRQLFFLEPETLIFAIRTNGVAFLRDVWVKDVGGDPAVAKEIDCKVIGSDPNRTIIVIAPPRPAQPTDAYLIALVLKDNRPRYFTFEKIQDLYKTGIEAVLCEWTESEHKNHSMATAKPTLDTFMAMIDQVMNKEAQPLAP